MTQGSVDKVVAPDVGVEAPAISMAGVTKAFATATVLDGIDFDVRAGEIHALMGENGAGKSTLIKILAGDLEADGGTICREGVPVAIRTVADARRNGIAVVHQELSVVPNLTITENLFLGRELTSWRGLDRRMMRKEAKGTLERLGLKLDPDTPIGRLDIAERQAVEVCKALAENAKVLILDEPTAALTEAERQKLFTVLDQLRAEGLALVYVSHHLSEIDRLADRVTVLRNGKCVLSREKRDATEAQIVFAMLGEPVEEMFPRAAHSHTRPGAASETVIRFDGVSYGRRALGIDLDVKRGEIVGVTGLLGSGHHEVGRLAAGMIKPTSGQIDSARRLVRLSPGDRKSEGLAMGRTGVENLTVHALDAVSRGYGALKFLSAGKERKISRSWASRLKVAGDITKEVGLLSGGNQQKILIGRNLDGQADLLVLEEPTRGVDIGARQDLYRLVRAEADRGAAVLVISTDLREVAGLCDRVIVLNRGKKVSELTGESVSEERVYEACHQEKGKEKTNQAALPDGAGPAVKRRTFDRALVPWLALLTLTIIAAIASPKFLSAENLQNVAAQSVTGGLVGLGQLAVILTGHIDLSIGAVVGLTNLVSADLIMMGVPAGLVLVVVVVIGALVGIANATLVRLGMPSLLATFAMASVIRGLVLWFYPKSLGPVPDDFTLIDRHEVLGIPSAFVVLLLIFAAAGWLLKRTRIGLHLYAVGGDARGALLSGVRTDRMVLIAFVASGVSAALAGFHLTGRIAAGLPNSGLGLELDALAVVMIGGASIAGGAGTARGVLAGVGIVAVLANLMNLTGLDAFLQNPIKGAVIILVAIVWALREHTTARKARLGTDTLQ